MRVYAQYNVLKRNATSPKLSILALTRLCDPSFLPTGPEANYHARFSNIR